MKDCCRVTEEDLRLTEDYLKGYRLNRQFLRMERYEKEFFGYRPSPEDWYGESPRAKQAMIEIRAFVMSLPNCEEKLLLYYHYIRNESVERCAELLNMSRSSAFRLKKCALLLAASHRKDGNAGDAGDAGEACSFLS